MGVDVIYPPEDPGVGVSVVPPPENPILSALLNATTAPRRPNLNLDLRNWEIGTGHNDPTEDPWFEQNGIILPKSPISISV